MKLSSIKEAGTTIDQGQWVERIPNLAGIRILARASGNADYKALEAALDRAIPAAVRAAGLGPDDHAAILGQLLLQTVVLDVDGLLEEDGTTPLKYTKDIGAKLLRDPDYKAFQAGAAYAGEAVAGKTR